MLRRFLGENKWYLIALCISLGVTVLCVYAFFGTRAIEVNRTQNMARADSLSAAIVALPKIESIIPAKTSDQVSYVATSRLNLSRQIASEYTAVSALWIYGLIPAYYAKTTQQAKHNAINMSAQTTLDQTAKHLTNLKKIIEYMPLVDLATPFEQDQVITERLDRTKRGIKEAIEYIRWTNLPSKSEINARLISLNARTLSLKDETKEKWAEELLEIQKLILRDIKNQDIKGTDIPAQLQTAAQFYDIYQ